MILRVERQIIKEWTTLKGKAHERKEILKNEPVDQKRNGQIREAKKEWVKWG